MSRDILRALSQISDPRFLRVLLLGLALSLGLLFAFTVFLTLLVGAIVPESFVLPWIGEIAWIDNALSLAVIPVMLVASVFLMVPVASAFSGVFLDDIATAVEARHYPGAAASAKLPFLTALSESTKFLLLLVVVNLFALILYLLLAPLAPVIFWGINGFLLGREYATLVALRHLGADGARAYRRAHGPTIWLLGVLMAIPLTIPLVNLLVPILGVAAFTHQYHRLTEPAQL